MEQFLEIISVTLTSAVKFVFAAFFAGAYDWSYWQTMLITALGGIIGVLFFFFFSQWVMKMVTAYKNKMYFLFGINAGNSTSKKKVFNWQNRLIVKVVKTFGLVGIAAITPALLSIPLGTFIATRYFRDKKKVVAYLCLSVVVWAFILSTVVVIF